MSELILVGCRDFNAFGSHGSTSHLRFRHFHSLLDARSFFKEKGCDICGVEITDGAVAVNEQPFKRSTAFLLGNEGMVFFIYIHQYGSGTALLNVTVAASIVLHHFGVWAGFSERTPDCKKFVVAHGPVKRGGRNFCAKSVQALVEERKSRRENGSGVFDDSANGNSSENLLDSLFIDE